MPETQEPNPITYPSCNDHNRTLGEQAYDASDVCCVGVWVLDGDQGIMAT